MHMHGGSQSRYGAGIEHSPIAPSGAWKVTHHTKGVNAAKCGKQQRNSTLHKTETELPKLHAILKPQAGQDSDAEANAERRLVHMHGDNHSRYGAGLEHSSIVPSSPRPALNMALTQPSQPTPMCQEPHHEMQTTPAMLSAHSHAAVEERRKPCPRQWHQANL
ncbi:hypothetical protein V6N11_056185 [Hibiscus sabdariffa]|uniref:Uncharacterized protein n=1 Tax=Hibiscus sabdariffa TaxID=183260 RepID=A0ABR2T3V7_9ROSI